MFSCWSKYNTDCLQQLINCSLQLFTQLISSYLRNVCFIFSLALRLNHLHQTSSSDLSCSLQNRLHLFMPNQTSSSLYATQLTASTAGLNVSEAVHAGLHVR
ncbi:hypothetical protein F511_11678 [Dorcoceras hygrometricum]|uniref:Uncharacterized protein n=1 Tax=Dorcoceras hygrometricum TaxID=472368 RepID=A0A2Z7B450_9LAMI|nr:hypothetical protein F511_11678 [Dorcoceras hygrometricum]